MSQYFPKLYEPLGGNVKVELDSSSLKVEVDKKDKDKLKAVPADLSTLINVVDDDVLEKTVYYKLVNEVNTIDTRGFALSTQYNTDKSGLEKKIDDNDKKNA